MRTGQDCGRKVLLAIAWNGKAKVSPAVVNAIASNTFLPQSCAVFIARLLP